ncbi:MAG: hypothetical protein VXY10_05130 [Candidatus Thermoplasmatota archaeon]|nr:hypothetical protein [Candidatus Thermoplasmatota archaeon]MEC8680562.1 hypothetical protein [Candidatus Thermoplasmatota archaeon]
MVGIVGFQSEPIKKKSLLKSLKGITQKLCKDHGIDMQDIGLIVHTGMYRQNFRVEPAFAAHLQQALKIRCENIDLNTKHVFSFDVTDGICGPHHALETIADLLPDMDCTYALFTAGDVRPTKETEWEHDPISFAAVLSRDGPVQLLESRYDGEHLNEFTSSTKFKKKHHGTTMTSSPETTEHRIDGDQFTGSSAWLSGEQLARFMEWATTKNGQVTHRIKDKSGRMSELRWRVTGE